MNDFGAVLGCVDDDKFQLTLLRDALRSATDAPHERLHLHDGFSRVKDGTISLLQYRALLVRLYGFYLPFEHAVGAEPLRTRWLEADLAWSGVNADTISHIPRCADVPRYDGADRRLGALYVVEGSALGGRQLCRGLDRLLGRQAIDGRRFFAGRGAETGAAWLGYLDRLAAAGPEPTRRDGVIGAAIETFAVFEKWLSGWDKTA